MKHPMLGRYSEEALCIYTDATLLTPADMASLAERGLAAVGLQCLDSVTDYGVVISGEVGVLLDPHRQVGAAFKLAGTYHGKLMGIVNPPGRGMDTLPEPLITDALGTLQSLFPLTNPRYVQGTVMRLPLRNITEARTHNTVDTLSGQYITSFLAAAKEISEPAILFGRTLEHITWSEARGMTAAQAKKADGTATGMGEDGEGTADAGEARASREYVGSAGSDGSPGSARSSARSSGKPRSAATASGRSPRASAKGARAKSSGRWRQLVRYRTQQIYSVKLNNPTPEVRQQRLAPCLVPEFVIHRGPTFYKLRLQTLSEHNGNVTESSRTNDWKLVQAIASQHGGAALSHDRVPFEPACSVV